MTLCRVLIVVQRREHCIVPDQAATTDVNAAVILKTAPGIEEYILANVDIFSEIGVKWREQVKTFRDRFSDNLREN